MTFFATPYLDSDPITQLWLLLPTVLIALFGYLAVLAIIELVWARRHPAGPRAGDAPVSG